MKEMCAALRRQKDIKSDHLDIHRGHSTTTWENFDPIFTPHPPEWISGDILHAPTFVHVEKSPPSKASQCGYVVSTSAFRQGVPGSNPIAARKSFEVYPGLGILQPQWNPYPTLTPPSC